MIRLWPAGTLPDKERGDNPGWGGRQTLFGRIMAENEKVVQAVRERAVDNRLSCPEARRLAAELGVPVKEVGRAADEAKVKITDCELGCF